MRDETRPAERRTRGRGRLALALGVLLVAGAARAETNVATATEQPWDRSVRLEQAGDLGGAEAVLVEAWGKHPDNYYAQLRLAYLALVTKRANAALSRYRRARLFPEAKGDADAKAGYAAALALKGWKLTDAGQTEKARLYFKQALAVEPTQPEALTGLATTIPPVSEPEL